MNVGTSSGPNATFDIQVKIPHVVSCALASLSFACRRVFSGQAAFIDPLFARCAVLNYTIILIQYRWRVFFKKKNWKQHWIERTGEELEECFGSTSSLKVVIPDSELIPWPKLKPFGSSSCVVYICWPAAVLEGLLAFVTIFSFLAVLHRLIHLIQHVTQGKTWLESAAARAYVLFGAIGSDKSPGLWTCLVRKESRRRRLFGRRRSRSHGLTVRSTMQSSSSHGFVWLTTGDDRLSCKALSARSCVRDGKTELIADVSGSVDQKFRTDRTPRSVARGIDGENFGWMSVRPKVPVKHFHTLLLCGSVLQRPSHGTTANEPSYSSTPLLEC